MAGKLWRYFWKQTLMFADIDVRKKGRGIAVCSISCGSQAGLGSLFGLWHHAEQRTSQRLSPAVCPSKCAGIWRKVRVVEAVMELEGHKGKVNGHPVIVLAVCSDLMEAVNNLFNSYQETRGEKLQTFCHFMSRLKIKFYYFMQMESCGEEKPSNKWNTVKLWCTPQRCKHLNAPKQTARTAALTEVLALTDDQLIKYTWLLFTLLILAEAVRV